jgi:hypothetical protein
MLALPYLSGTDCIGILERFGYRVASRRAGLASLQRGADAVIIPEASTLSPTLVGAILRTARIDPAEVVRELSTGVVGVSRALSKQVA